MDLGNVNFLVVKDSDIVLCSLQKLQGVREHRNWSNSAGLLALTPLMLCMDGFSYWATRVNRQGRSDFRLKYLHESMGKIKHTVNINTVRNTYRLDGVLMLYFPRISSSKCNFSKLWLDGVSNYKSTIFRFCPIFLKNKVIQNVKEQFRRENSNFFRGWRRWYWPNLGFVSWKIHDFLALRVTL